ncbi:MAG: hypothetical protein KAJ44_00410 [Thermoplasmatales archaeon]|nr:hypothetical protein [Thermoplasmatales archaeon]
MRKQLIKIVAIDLLIMISVFSSVVLADRVDFVNEIAKKCLDEVMIDENETSVITYGPILPSLNIVEINFDKGVSSQIQKIEQVLNNRILHFIIPSIFIICTDLDFNVTYNKNISMLLPFIRRFSYFTTVFNKSDFAFNNKTIYGESHTIIIKGFNGFFIFIRGHSPTLNPANFVFVGNCKELTII